MALSSRLWVHAVVRKATQRVEDRIQLARQLIGLSQKYRILVGRDGVRGEHAAEVADDGLEVRREAALRRMRIAYNKTR